MNQRVTTVLASARGSLVAARATVRALARVGASSVLVVDVDGSYRATGAAGGEQIAVLGDLTRESAVRAWEARAAAATLDPHDLLHYAALVGAASVVASGPGVVLAPGVLPLVDPAEFAAVLDRAELLVVPAVDLTGLAARQAEAREFTARDPANGWLRTSAGPAAPSYSRAVLAASTTTALDALCSQAGAWRTVPSALEEVVASLGGAVRVADEPAVLVGAWRGEAADSPRVWAVDLTRLDPDRPWVLDPELRVMPSTLLSRHPELAALVAAEAGRRRADVARLAEQGDDRSPGLPDEVTLPDEVLRGEARRTDAAGGGLPDVLGLVGSPDLEAWALGLVPEGDPRPVARYLGATWWCRPDLRQAFPAVPGADARALARWARRAGVHEPGTDPELLARAAGATLAARFDVRDKSPAPGVTLVGYLAGELGLGESARQVDAALQAAGVATSTMDVSRDLESRRGADYRRSADQVVHTTSLICVNGAETAALVPRLGPLLGDSRVVGMWYWELEDLPAGHRVGFGVVDEVWAATDFMRAAIARHAGHVPVRTVMPPLPQAGPDRGEVPRRFGIPPDRPWFLFVFDYQSFAERKNPEGLVAAFTRAFGDPDRPDPRRPVLVLKTINADRHPADAERLRLLVAGRDDVVLIEEYLAHDERHVLAAHCTAFVSLHRAEGLGLTVAEAMAWARPVIVTGYGGVLQFCNDENAFLVDFTPGRVPRDVGPYSAGSVWAEPDLDHAAHLMRLVLDDPTRAAAVGDRAALDIRTRHSPSVAGAAMRDALTEGEAAWRKQMTAAPEKVTEPPAPQDRRRRVWGRGRPRGGGSSQ